MTSATMTEVSFALPIYADWDAEDVWRLIKPFIYKDDDGALQMSTLDLQPDGEPTGYTRVVIKDGKDYIPNGKGGDCECDTSQTMCRKHWREIRPGELKLVFLDD